MAWTPTHGNAAEQAPSSDALQSAYKQCLDKHSDNASWGQCGATLIDGEEKLLNETWQRVFPRYAGRSKQDLLQEQRAWIAYKDKSCRMWGNGDWGREGTVLEFPACRARVIEARVKELQALGARLDERR